MDETSDEIHKKIADYFFLVLFYVTAIISIILIIILVVNAIKLAKFVKDYFTAIRAAGK